MSRVVTFGEIMLRLNPQGFLRFLQADCFEATYAGGEANVAVSLANLGHVASFVTKAPQHEIGQSAINALRHFGVDTTQVVRGGRRLGVYYVEKGASQRAGKVIYDREYSAIALAERNEFDWDRILDGVEWFHFTGITPALGGSLPQICLDALGVCKERGIKVSCDLNYRSKLWSSEEAGHTMAKMMPYVDLLIANESDMKDVFGISLMDTDVTKGILDHTGYENAARELSERFGIDTIAITLRGSISATENDWAAMLFHKDSAYFSTNYRMHLVDRVGGGDSFAGALIHALLGNMDRQDAVEFAVAASCLKHSIEHDFNLISNDEVISLMRGNASGRVQR